MKRVALLTEIPAPFRIPLFNALAERVDLEVLFLSSRDPKRPYRVYTDEFRFASITLPRFDIVLRGKWIVFSYGVRRALRRCRPDAIVVGGWNQPAFWIALFWARARHVPVIAWVESTSRDERSGRPVIEGPKGVFIRRCAGFLVPGRASRAYLCELGIADHRIVEAPNAVDASLFGARVDRKVLRRELGLIDCTFLYVGRFDPEKGLDVLLKAFVDVPGELVLIGSGCLEESLRAMVAERVRIVRRLEREELARWYAAADVFVLPSRSEQWGMVLNEAALAGLPIVATDAAGAAHELVEDGVNGFRVPVEDVSALHDALLHLAGDPEFRVRAGQRSRELVAPLTPDAWSTAVVRAISSAGAATDEIKVRTE